jgi:hypothetical protein
MKFITHYTAIPTRYRGRLLSEWGGFKTLSREDESRILEVEIALVDERLKEKSSTSPSGRMLGCFFLTIPEMLEAMKAEHTCLREHNWKITAWVFGFFPWNITLQSLYNQGYLSEATDRDIFSQFYHYREAPMNITAAGCYRF